MKIVMDKEKIVGEDEVTVEKVHDRLVKIFDGYSFVEIEKNIFAHISNVYSENKIAEILSAYMIAFSQCEWFIKYIKEWKWINDETNYTEDLINTLNIFGR